jgi:RNA-directed DNA polymerase
LCSEDKFRIVLNLKYLKFNSSLDSFYIPKKSGTSFLFSSSNFYVKSLYSLYNASILPLVESKTDKFSLGMRPFRDCRDIFLEIKKFFFINRKDHVVLKFRLSLVNSLFENSWFLKNIPMEKHLLKSWLISSNRKDVSPFDSFYTIGFDFLNSTNIFFSLAFTGLV